MYVSIDLVEMCIRDRHQDADSAKAIMEGDSEIDREQKKIESLCFNLLIQQQPVARDLRTISAAIKMFTYMERIGDHAADISEMTILMSSDKPYRVNIEHVKSMASETMLMLIRAIEAYVEKNNDKAHVVMKQDDVVDELFDKVKAELIDFIREHPEAVSYTHLDVYKRQPEQCLYSCDKLHD